MPRVEGFEVKGACDRLLDQLEAVPRSGKQRDAVDTALRRLIDQFDEARRAIEISEQRRLIDEAEEQRAAAEERLAELETI